MSKILAKGMITLTQLYEGAQVILTPAVVLIPCNSEETPKPNAYINASTNVKAFLGTMDITSGITLGELEYSDSTVRASKTGTKVSITTITTRTGYVDIPVSATINGETIDLGKHRFNFVKQIDGQTGQPGAPGDPGFGYTLNIKGGTRGIAYAANGTNPEPKTSSQFSVELLKNGVKVANPASISWTCGGNLSGSSSAATFTPTIKSTYASGSSYVKVSVKEFAASLAVEETIPIICTKHADGLDWINEWNNQYVQVGTEKIITPKIFAGTKNSANELTGVAIGRDVLGGNANKVIGIVGYKKNTPVFSLDQDANFFVSSSGSAGDIKNGTNNAKGIYFDGNNLYVSGKVRINGGSTIGESNTSVEDVINNSNLGAQANNKIDNLSIGGRNLLRNTSLNGIAFPYSGNDYNWRTASTNEGPGISRTKVAITDNDSFREIYGIKVVNTTSTAYNCDIAQDNVKMEDGATYTMSAYFKVISGNPTWRLQYGTNPYPVKTGTVKSGWNKYSYTFKYDKTQFSNKLTTNIYFGFVGANFEGYICGFKLEKGNKATDWTPAPEDVQIDINNAIDNIQIGGRNLVSNSNLGGLTSNAYGFGVRKVIGGLKNNTTYTFSVNGRSNPNGNTEGKSLMCYIYEKSWNHGAWQFGIGETTSTTRSLTFTTGNTIEGKDVEVAFYWYPSGGDRTGNATINWCKVEQGNKATDWTPAPEDIDNNITDVKNSLSGFQNTVNTTFKDGIIEQAEAKAIARHIQILDTEKVDVDKEYSTIYNNSALSGTAKTNLASAKTEFDNAHTSLKSTINTAIADGKVSSSEKTSVDSKFSTYNSILGVYKQRVQEALDAISSAKVDNVQVGGRNLAKNSIVIAHSSSGSLDKSNYISSGTLISTVNGVNQGFKFDSQSIYEANQQYVLSFCIQKQSGTIDRLGMTHNGKSHKNVKVVCDGISKGDFTQADTSVGTIMNDGNVHKIEVYFTTSSNIPVDSGVAYTYIQLNKSTGTPCSARITKFKLEKGTKPTDWSPAPEDINAEISAVNNKADNAQSTANTANNTANAVNTTVNNNKNNWSNAYNRVVEWASGAVTGSTNINGGMIATDTITAKQLAIGDFNNYSQLVKGKNLVNRHGTANWVEGTNGHSYWQTTNAFFPFTVSETLNPFKAGDKIQIKFDAYTPSTRNVNVGVWFFSDTSASSNIGSVAGAVSCSASWGTKTVNLTLPTGNTYVQNAKSIAILIHNGSSGERIEVRNATVNRLVAGDLIVNGTITTDHIHTNGLNANVIKAGTISADRLDANTIVSKVNGGTTEINGNRIQTGTLSASKITTGTLDANKVNVTNLNASNIKSGTIDASKISVTNLNASSITSGTLGGGYNLLKNSKAQNGTNFWLNNGGGISTATHSTYKTCFKTQAPSGMKYHESIKLKNNTEYVYEGCFFSETAISGSSVVPLHYWCMSTANTAGQSQLTVLDYRQSVPVNRWTKCYVHFRTASSGDVYFTPFVYVGGSATFNFWATELSLSENSVESRWTPHPSEIYEGSTIIDATGVTVNNGALRVKNKSGTTVLSGDSNGNLVLAGSITSNATIKGGTIVGSTLKSNNGDMLFDMNNGYMLLYNNGTKIAQTNKNSVAGTSIYGVSNGAEYGSYACLSAKVSSSASNYQMMITASGRDLPDANLKKGVNLGNTFNSNNWHFNLGSSTQLTWRQNGSNHDSFITEGSDGMLRLFGDNGMFLGYRNGNTNTFVIAIRENGSHTYPKSLSVFDDGVRPATDNNGYSLEISAPLNMKGQSINQCSNIKTLGLEFIEPIAFNRNREGKTRTLKVTKNTQNIVEFIGSTAIKNGEAIVDLPSDVSFKNYVVLLTPIGLDRKVSIIEKNDDNFKIVGDDGIVDYVIKFESMDYANYIRKSISEDNTDIIVRSEEDKPKEIFVEN